MAEHMGRKPGYFLIMFRAPCGSVHFLQDGFQRFLIYGCGHKPASSLASAGSSMCKLHLYVSCVTPFLIFCHVFFRGLRSTCQSRGLCDALDCFWRRFHPRPLSGIFFLFIVFSCHGIILRKKV